MERCEGTILAHSLSVDGTRFRKGRVLSASDIRALLEAGIEQLTVARPGQADVGEDEAATMLASAAAGAGTHVRKPFGGRVNVTAICDGLVQIKSVALERSNQVSEAITTATVADSTRVRSGDLIATIKIIPFAVPEADVQRASDAAADSITVAPFRRFTAEHVLTTLPDTTDKLLDLSRTGVNSRVADLGGSVREESTSQHNSTHLADALRSANERKPDLILVSGASAIVDRRDVIPAAVEMAGGSIDHFGMPVDPGNLLLLGTLGSSRVIGLPGCARAPARNGLDLVLERFAANVGVDSAAVVAMGPGGLLKKSASRRRTSRAPKIAAVILAAGKSRRMGEKNKLLEEVGGASLVVNATRAAIASEATPVIVVTGHEPERVTAALEGLDVTTVHNARFDTGLSSSLQTGIEAVPPEHDGVILLLADMPAVDSDLVDRMLAAFDPIEGRAIVVATHHGTRGNPVLFARSYFPDIQRVTGDTGARHVVDRNEEMVCEIECLTDAPLVDLDTPEELARWRRK